MVELIDNKYPTAFESINAIKSLNTKQFNPSQSRPDKFNRNSRPKVNKAHY